MNFGDWEGRFAREILLSEDFSRWARHPLENSPPGGESLLGLSERVLAAWEEVLDSWAGGNIAVVAHGGPLRVLIGHLVGIPLEAIHRICQDHAGLSLVTMEPEPRLLLLNDPCHAQD
jgi:broad specificity phosphatase PhoE